MNFNKLVQKFHSFHFQLSATHPVDIQIGFIFSRTYLFTVTLQCEKEFVNLKCEKDRTLK